MIYCVIYVASMVLVIFVMMQLQQDTTRIHLQDLSTNILNSNFIEFANSFLVDNDNNRF